MKLIKSNKCKWRELLDLSVREIKGFHIKSTLSREIQHIGKDLSECIECNELIIEPGVEDVYHYHNFAYDIFRVESGVLTIIINGKMTKLRPGDWIIVEPGEKHRIGNQSSAQVVVQEVRLHVVDGDKLEAKNSYRKGS